MMVMSVASTLRYTGTKTLDPIEQAMKFVRGYMQANGPFYDAPEQSNKLVTQTMKVSEFIRLLELSRSQNSSTKLDQIFEIYNSLDKLERPLVETMATTKQTAKTEQTDLDAMIAQKTAQAQEKPVKQYEENTTGYVNHVELSGNLGRDTEVTALPSGQIVAKNGLGMFNPGSKDETHNTKWFDLTMWLQKEATAKYPSNAALFQKFIQMEKGNKVVVSGRLTFRYWKTKDGQERETAVITVTDIG